MPYQSLSIDLNLNLGKLQDDFDRAQQISGQAFGKIQQSAAGAGAAIGDAANQADFGDLSKDAKDAAASMDALRTSTTGTGTAADQAKSKLGALFAEIDAKAGEAYDSLASKGKVVGTAISIGIGLLLAGTVAGVIYTATRAVEALGSAVNDYVVTGKGYQSANIDALDEQDKHVRKLQSDLVTTAQAASALDLAFKQTGVPKDDYTSVYKATDDAINKAIDDQEKLFKAVSDARHLDPANEDTADKIKKAEKALEDYSNAFQQLGIKYQDANYKGLDTTTVIANSAKALGDYEQGYDRNAAAAALAIGTFTQVANAAKITDAAFDAAAERQKAYFLIIGPNTQAALDEYHKAVEGFKTESDLMSQGFKAAIAEAILPQLAGLADYFKDGFPAAVGAFREVLTAAVATLEFFKTGVFAITQPVIAAFEAIGIGAAAGMLAVQKALHFDFTGALKELDDGRKAIIERFASLPDEVSARIAIAEKNINLARGSESTDKSGKSIIGIGDDKDSAVAPKLEDRPEDTGAGYHYTARTGTGDDAKEAKARQQTIDVAKKLLDQQLKNLDLFIGDEKSLLTSRDEFLSLYYQHGDVSIRDYFDQRKASQDEYVASAKKGYNEEIADLEAYIAKTKADGGITDDQTTARVTDAQTKLLEVRNKLRKVESDASQETLKDWFANRDAVEQYSDQLNALAAQIKTFSGDTAGAFETTFEAQNRQLKRQLTAVLNSDSSTQDERNRATQGLVDLDQIKQQGLATAKLNDLSLQRNVILGDLANTQARIDTAVSSGQKTELQGLADSSAANAARLASLQKIVDAYEAIAAASNNPMDRVNADALRVELEKLATQTDLVADKFRDIGESVTENFLDKALDKTTTLREKFKSLFTDLNSQLLKVAEKNIAEQLFGTSGSLSGFGAFFSKTLGLGTPSSSSAGAAVGAVAQAGGSAANDPMGDFIKSIDTANGKLDDLSSGGIAGMAKSAYDYIAKQLFGVTTQAAATTATTSATTALAALTNAAYAAATALSAAGGGGSGGGALGGLAGFFGKAGAGSSALASTSSTAGASINAGITDEALALFANGAAFGGGAVVPFANGDVFQSATIFPMAGGRAGMLGEAGPEAIMPLRRTADGRLGVAAHGMGGGAAMPTVHNHYTTVQVTQPVGGNRGSATQWGAEVGRQLRVATNRNG